MSNIDPASSPRDSWSGADDVSSKKPPEKKGLLGRLVNFLLGGKFNKVMSTVHVRIEEIKGTNKQSTQQLMNTKKVVEQAYSKTIRLAQVVDGRLKVGGAESSKEAVMDQIYQKLEEQLFPPALLQPGDNLDRPSLDSIYETLTNPNPTEIELAKLDRLLDRRFGSRPKVKLQWYTKMAEGNYPTASLMLARHYKSQPNGGIKSLECYRDAAVAGSLPAQLRLAEVSRAYAEKAESPDKQERFAMQAHHWTSKAASTSDEAWLQLATDLAEGYGVKKNNAGAIAHFTEIIAKVDNKVIQAKAHYQLGRLVEAEGNPDKALQHYGNAVELTPEMHLGSAEEKKIAMDLYHKIAELAPEQSPQRGQALMILAEMHLSTDLGKAFTYYSQAAQTGKAEAEIRLLQILRDHPNSPELEYEEDDLTQWLTNGLAGFLAAEAERSDLSPGIAEATLRSVAKWTAEESMRIDSSDRVDPMVRLKQLSPEERVGVSNLVAIAKHQSPPLSDHSLLAGALFGTDAPTFEEVAVAEAFFVEVERTRIRNPELLQAQAFVQYAFKQIFAGPTEGIFRLAGREEAMEEFEKAVEEERSVTQKPIQPHQLAMMGNEHRLFNHDIATLTKRAVKEQTLIPTESYHSLISLAKENMALSDEEFAKKLSEFVKTLPTEKLALLSELMIQLNKLGEYEKTTRMTPSNLSICWSPNLLLPPNDSDPLVVVANLAFAGRIVEVMIKHPNIVFS